jgi:signal transduction histidine kinase
MGTLPRIGFYLALFLGFVLGAQFLQNWLNRQTQSQLRALNQAAVAEKRAQFDRVIERQGFDAATSVEAFAELARSIGVQFASDGAPDRVSTGKDRTLFLDYALPGDRPVRLVVPAPAMTTLLTIYHRVTFGLILLCPVLFGFGLLIASVSRRGAKADRTSRPPWATSQAEAAGFERLAKLSNERTEALALEHKTRLRIEQDLLVNRTMLDQSLSERVRLGRELHDNICQTLYAVCLTLESVQKKNTLAPELSARVDQCMVELKRVNHEVRAYLEELNPVSVQSRTFEHALASLIASFAREGVTIESRVEADAFAGFDSAKIAEVTNLMREAVSNALRHGNASQINIRVASSGDAIAISVQDNGRGFTVPNEGRSLGHGLDNMRTRATELGGELTIESAAGRGTRICLTLPAEKTE